MSEIKKTRVVIIGSGPAGLTAALYTARALYDTVVITGKYLGGQIATTSDVENFPGFPDGIQGPELTERMKQQAEKFGAKFVLDEVVDVDFEHGSPFTVRTYSDTYLADAVVVTIGASPRHLHVPGEVEYTGYGVSYCATCDGFFFRNKDIIVVGGGDSALQEGIFLTKFARSVSIVHRRDSLRASIDLQKKAQANPKINFVWDTVIDEVKGETLEGGIRRTTGVTLRNVKTDEVREHPIDGVFIFIGYNPNSKIFGTQLGTNDDGYMLVDDHMRTSVPGIFAGGEIHDFTFRQAITAAGQGCAAALSAIHWLQANEDTLQPLDVSPSEALVAGA
jgi:thioredoxin reductase (NADPH)